MGNKIPSQDIIKHLKISNLFKGIDVNYYAHILNKIENNEKILCQSNMEHAKVQRVFQLYSDIKTSTKSLFFPLRFKTDCCDNDVVFNSKELFYICPTCCMKVSSHKDFMPKGVLATKKIAKVRAQLHKEFDGLWQNNVVSRSKAYCLLADKLNMERYETHIGNVSGLEQAALFYHGIIQLKSTYNVSLSNCA